MNKLDLMKMSKHQVIFDAHERPIKLDMKTYQRYRPSVQLQTKVSPRKTDKIFYNQKMVNDYVDIINQRLSVDTMDKDFDSMRLSQRIQPISKSFGQPEINIQSCISKTNLDSTPKNSHIMHSRKSLTKEDKLYLLSDPFQELAKTRQSMTDLRAIELDGDHFTQEYKNKISEDYEKEVHRKDMLQRKIFDSQLKYQGNNSIKQFIFQQNMKMSTKVYTEPIHIIDVKQEKLQKNKFQKPLVMRSFQESQHSERFDCLYETCDNFYKDSRQIKKSINRLKKQTWRKYRQILVLIK